MIISRTAVSGYSGMSVRFPSRIATLVFPLRATNPQRAFEHLCDSALVPLVVDEAFSTVIGLQNSAIDCNSGNAKVGVDALRVIAERHHSGKRRLIVLHGPGQRQNLIVRAAGE